jgi:hypothetical protein
MDNKELGEWKVLLVDRGREQVCNERGEVGYWIRQRRGVLLERRARSGEDFHGGWVTVQRQGKMEMEM